MITDTTKIRLGRLPRKDDHRNIKASALLAAAPLTVTPDSLDWFDFSPPSGVMLNDTYGDCVVAEDGHHEQICSGITIPDSVIKSVYLKLSPNDEGLYLLDYLKWRTKNPLGVAAPILGFAQVNADDLVELKQVALLFGGLKMAVDMPIEWQSATVWDVVSKSRGIWGGHCFIQGVYPVDGEVCEVFTWGYRQRMTWRAIQHYCGMAAGGEVYGVLRPSWVAKGAAPNGFLVDALKARLAAIT